MGEKNWTQKGALPSGALPKAVAVSPEGYGLVAAYVDPAEGPPSEQLRQRKAQLLRVTASGAEQVYEAAGWIASLDGHGSLWFALGATLKAAGAGSDYRLLRSTDGGKTWQGRGTIPAPSAAQVLAVDERQAWVLGAGYLGVTLDGGASWQTVQLQGERNPTLERLRRAGNSVALVGRGLAFSLDFGNSWARDEVGGAQVHDFDGEYLVVSKGNQVGVGRRQGNAITWLTGLPADRHPLRITSTGPVVRILSRAADPSRNGVDLTVYRSEDGGKAWTGIPLGLRAEADIAGEYGLGVNLAGELQGNF